MNINTLFEKTRSLLQDFKYNSNDSSSDQMFSDELLIDGFNSALFDFDFKTNFNRKAYSDTDVQITTANDVAVYNLPDKVLQVFSVKRGDKTLWETNYEVSVILNDVECNAHPETYQLNYKNKQIRLMPTPDGVYTIKLRCSVETETFTLSDLDTEIPLPAKYHEDFKYFIASRCLEIQDIDAEDVKKSQMFMNKWDEHCRKVRLEIIRRTGNVVNITNGDYNAW